MSTSDTIPKYCARIRRISSRSVGRGTSGELQGEVVELVAVVGRRDRIGHGRRVVRVPPLPCGRVRRVRAEVRRRGRTTAGPARRSQSTARSVVNVRQALLDGPLGFGGEQGEVAGRTRRPPSRRASRPTADVPARQVEHRSRTRRGCPRRSTVGDRRTRRCRVGRRPGRCSRTRRARSRPAGRRGRRCRTADRAASRCPPPGCSSDTCRCRGTPARARTAKPGCSAGRGAHRRRPARRAAASGRSDAPRSPSCRPAAGRASPAGRCAPSRRRLARSPSPGR